MTPFSQVLQKAGELAAAGRHAELVAYLRAADSELETSPSLALLYGTAQARLGHHDEGLQWLDRALDQARRQNQPAVERHALNARGALALVSGRLDEAADYITQALVWASRDGDLPTIGRCSNNLGIINNLRGRQAEAIGSWEVAVAAFERAGLPHGVAECRNNLAIVYRQQGALDRALAEANHAVAAARTAGDRALWGTALRGRAEIHVQRGERELARCDLDQVQHVRRAVPDPVAQAEDLRVAALLLEAEGNVAAAEQALRDVIAQAETCRRPQLVADATRDLALVFRKSGRTADAHAAARMAKAMFAQLGAEGEIRQLAGQGWDHEFAAELRWSLEPLPEVQALADTGRYAELIRYLGGRSQAEVEQSPMLALLHGIAYRRLGRLEVGRHWAAVALARAQALGDRTLEVRALNACANIAVQRGGISEGTEFFAHAPEEATRGGDLVAIGRCANNLGVLATMQGNFSTAVAAYDRAIAAYETVRNDRGIAETRHHLGITYREQGQLDSALEAADAAVRAAERVGDKRLRAQFLAGRAEIRIARGELDLAIGEAESALATHRELNDSVREADDLRILAVALYRAGETEDAEDMLRAVIDRATEQGQPLLLASAQRDLAHLLVREGEATIAKKMAQAARATFNRLGATVDVEKLDAFLDKLPGGDRRHGPPGSEQWRSQFRI